MIIWPLDRQGFVHHYMVSGPKVTPFYSEERDKNQLRYEAHLRAVVAEHAPLADTEKVCAGRESRLGMPWHFQGGKDTAFINLSDFYADMRRVAFDAATALYSAKAQAVRAVIWSYAAVDVYCNGAAVGSLRAAVYKPIGRLELTLPLKAGKNVVYFACETLGVRDTRSVIGLQIEAYDAEISAALPDEDMAKDVALALSFMEETLLTKDSLRFPRPAMAGTRWAWRQQDPDYAHAHRPVQWHSAAGETCLPLEEGGAYLELRVPAGQGELSRTFERTEQIKPLRVRPAPSWEENLHLVFQRVAAVESLSRGDEFGFPIANMLARKYLGDTSKDDAKLMDDMLALIEKRVDCADFLVCGLIRYVKNYAVPAKTQERIRQVLTHFRYWMDMDGFDAMCFWSENHSLMFYLSAMQAGEMYPEDDFPLARMTGRQLHEWGRGRVLAWLDDVEKYGFEEFLSTVYMCVTFAALLNAIDFTEEAISLRARRVTDKLLRMLAMHTFGGGIIAPQGRVYRGVLYPFSAGAMALMNLADPAQPYDYGEGWLGFYATSSYRFPADLKKLMDTPVSTTYTTGNARVVLEKRKDFCLTSVMIPRERFNRWENETKKPGVDPSTHSFVKSYNECFHGTTCFQPGVYGYQQHLWYAALDGEAAVFINHPGSASEGGDMRPGYWHGNGVFPALRQEGSLLGMIYRIPRAHPLHYIHAYVPECRFDEVRRQGNWLLLRKGKGFIGLWSSVAMEPWNGMNSGCEMRMWGDDIACLCLCAGEETENMDAFARAAEEMHPEYTFENGLRAGGYSLAWRQGQDDTQYL